MKASLNGASAGVEEIKNWSILVKDLKKNLFFAKVTERSND